MDASEQQASVMQNTQIRKFIMQKLYLFNTQKIYEIFTRFSLTVDFWERKEYHALVLHLFAHMPVSYICDLTHRHPLSKSLPLFRIQFSLVTIVSDSL